MTVKELADKLGTTRQNLHNKMTRNNFSESDLEKFQMHWKLIMKSTSLWEMEKRFN